MKILKFNEIKKLKYFVAILIRDKISLLLFVNIYLPVYILIWWWFNENNEKAEQSRYSSSIRDISKLII
jgi:hypothetical protein